ncbi:type III-A CRISPR-associated protein Csm2 [Thermaurantimonas aggregans]|uniref:CRISPR system Cms protein Csm2 n=1 Tax=Thermaurantimonas aggregans TaxID=2173829 RepID=A0A401XLW0_9FLAO|nr:type III-A CRISPR-associated protein Csm2 [Thermaurantimonas aggregans]MCX8149527.1 type III-A CRISPR-associated protein Csm2 [Thermaurantimonas aggregans]GCD77997.1 type III-A CRISPR-associated protein Csm2 [Thermaurantimonas aggregans]
MAPNNTSNSPNPKRDQSNNKKEVNQQTEKWNVKTEWITNGMDKEADKFCEKFGEHLATREKLSTSQLRNFYGELKRIQLNGVEKNKQNIQLLRPKLAYNAARKTNEGNSNAGKTFYNALKNIFRQVNLTEEKNFINFVSLIEAILAYHKYYGGK